MLTWRKYPHTWLNIFLGISKRMFLDETIWIFSLNEATCLLQYGRASSSITDLNNKRVRVHPLTTLSLLLIHIIAQIEIHVIITPIVASCFLPPVSWSLKIRTIIDCNTGLPLPSNWVLHCLPSSSPGLQILSGVSVHYTLFLLLLGTQTRMMPLAFLGL